MENPPPWQYALMLGHYQYHYSFWPGHFALPSRCRADEATNCLVHLTKGHLASVVPGDHYTDPEALISEAEKGDV